MSGFATRRRMTANIVQLMQKWLKTPVDSRWNFLLRYREPFTGALNPVGPIRRLDVPSLTCYAVITQCEIRKLYARKDEKGMRDVIESAKTLERRRCGHHPDQYPEPLGTQECLREVVDPKETGQNKHRYVVASQSQDVRRMLRAVRGVPLIYIKRSVMILEPMADESAQVRAREEKMKFRAGINRALGKRKRQGHDEEEEQDRIAKDQKSTDAADDKSAQDAEKKMKKPRGPKGPNPLSVKKAKKKPHELEQGKGPDGSEAPTEGTGKRKRRRKNKSAGEADGGGDDITATSVQ